MGAGEPDAFSFLHRNVADGKGVGLFLGQPHVAHQAGNGKKNIFEQRWLCNEFMSVAVASGEAENGMLPGSDGFFCGVAPHDAPFRMPAECIQALHGLDEKVPVVMLKESSPYARLLNNAYRLGIGGLTPVLASVPAHMGKGNRFSPAPCAGKAVAIWKNDDIVKKNGLQIYSLESFRKFGHGHLPFLGVFSSRGKRKRALMRVYTV